MVNARAARKSEQILSEIYQLFPHLIITTWKPLYDDAIEYARTIQVMIDDFINQLEAEKKDAAQPS